MSGVGRGKGILSGQGNNGNGMLLLEAITGILGINGSDVLLGGFSVHIIHHGSGRILSTHHAVFMYIGSRSQGMVRVAMNTRSSRGFNLLQGVAKTICKSNLVINRNPICVGCHFLFSLMG